jgi:hypothetical protein
MPFFGPDLVRHANGSTNALFTDTAFSNYLVTAILDVASVALPSICVRYPSRRPRLRPQVESLLLGLVNSRVGKAHCRIAKHSVLAVIANKYEYRWTRTCSMFQFELDGLQVFLNTQAEAAASSSRRSVTYSGNSYLMSVQIVESIGRLVDTVVKYPAIWRMYIALCALSKVCQSRFSDTHPTRMLTYIHT